MNPTPTQERAPETTQLETLLPRTDVHAGDAGCLLVCELPGVNEKDLTVELEGDELRIRGTTAWSEPEGLRLVHAEFEPACYERRFRLGEDLDPDSIQATLRDGLLRIHVQRRTPATRKIPIRAEAEGGATT